MLSTNSLELLPSLDFNPVLKPIWHNGEALPKTIGQKIVRDDTNEVLGIVKSRYVPQKYSALWEPLIEGLHESGLDLSNAEVQWRVINRGTAMYADITLKNYDYKHIIGEATALSLRVYNSVDGSLAYNVSAFIKRLVCLNGMTSIGDNTSVKFKHTAGTDPARIGRVASQWPVALERDAHLFNHMRNVPISPTVAQVFLAQFDLSVKKKWLSLMLSLHDRYRKTIGNNAYALYNALTDYGTHVDTTSIGGADLGQRALRQEKKVQDLVRGSAFKNLINYEEFEQRHVA